MTIYHHIITTKIVFKNSITWPRFHFFRKSLLLCWQRFHQTANLNKRTYQYELNVYFCQLYLKSYSEIPSINMNHHVICIYSILVILQNCDLKFSDIYRKSFVTITITFVIWNILFIIDKRNIIIWKFENLKVQSKDIFIVCFKLFF